MIDMYIYIYYSFLYINSVFNTYVYIYILGASLSGFRAESDSASEEMNTAARLLPANSKCIFTI